MADTAQAAGRHTVGVVGLGASGWNSLTAEGRALVEKAGVVLGGRRQLDLLPPEVTARRVTWGKPLRASIRPLVREHAPAGLVVLASGDPWHYGVGTTLFEELGCEAPDAPYRLHVVPGVSSIQLACARLGWSVESVDVLTAVGRDPSTVLRYAYPGRRLVMLVSRGAAVVEVSNLLVEAGFGSSDVEVLGNLGSEQESRVGRRASAWLTAGGVDDDGDELPRLAVLGITVRADRDDSPTTPTGNEHDRRSTARTRAGLTPGLPDEVFVADGTLTKWETRAVTLAALAPQPGQLLWDVGAGNGSVAVEWCRAHPTCLAVAVETRADRAANIEANARRFGVAAQVTVVVGSAPETLTELVEAVDAGFGAGEGSADESDVAAAGSLGAPHAIFVGGGLLASNGEATAPAAVEKQTDGRTPGTGLPTLDVCWRALTPGGRLVVNVVTLESEAELVRARAVYGGELGSVQASRAEPIGAAVGRSSATYSGWSTARPVVQWRATKPAL